LEPISIRLDKSQDASKSLLLPHYPLRRSALGLPGMEKLLGKRLQLRWVCSGFNGTVHPLHFKALRRGHCNRFPHHLLQLKTSLFSCHHEKELFHLKRNIHTV
jgi:hypothetical protein